MSWLGALGPSASHCDKVVSVLLPIVEGFGIEVSAVWPLYCSECPIELNGVEERQVLEGPDHLPFQDRPEIDSLPAAVVEKLYAMDGVRHRWPFT